jgi:MarR family transcriptional regulator, organic hydroperoxide resistance regulator
MRPVEEDVSGACAAAARIAPDLDVSWLLNRAAQLLTEAVHAEATTHGIGIRSQLVLSALIQESGRTQLALGAALVVDKTTLTTELDRLESCGLIQRLPDPRDRRVRIPEITDKGRQIQATVSEAIKCATDHQLAVLSVDERKILEEALRRLVESPSHTGQPGVSPV